MQCSNHLKQLGIAVHNFHDTKDGVPPAAIPTGIHSNSGVTFWGLIYPFIEQGSLYDLLKNKTNDLNTKCDNINFWGATGSTVTTILTPDERKGINSVSGYFCPSRRVKPDPYGDAPNSSPGDGPYFGPKGDYAIVYSTDIGTWPNWLRLPGQGGTIPGTSTGGYTMKNDDYAGPIRAATLISTNLGSWMPSDTMAWWSDGTSNQIVVGEKYIPQSYLNDCAYNNSPDDRGHLSDCSLLIAGGLTGFPSMRSFRAGFAKAPDTIGNILSDVDSPANPHWGGNHSGICNFLIGDGSVRSISTTIPTGNNQLLHFLGHVNDGNSVAIP
jgi:hypothetical protein